EELDERHRRRIAAPVAHLQNAEIPARPLPEPRPELGEQPPDRGLVTQPIERETAAARPVLLRERDQRLDDAPQLLRLRQRRAYRLVLQQRRREIPIHRAAVRGVAAEPAAGFSMTHSSVP